MNYNWVSLLGNFQKDAEKIIFKGGHDKDQFSGKEYTKIGNFLCDQFFGSGTIEATINFPKIAKDVTGISFNQKCGIQDGFATECLYARGVEEIRLN